MGAVNGTEKGTDMNELTLANGVRMPQEGFGVFQIPDHNEAKRVVLDALACGYRMVDTAAAYFNERAVGEAIRESGLPREAVFVETKIWVQDYGYERTLRAIDAALERLGLDFIDLLLLHQPIGDWPGAWRALETAYRAGKLRAIGMANCYPHVLADVCLTADIRPMVNQVEIHPFFQQEANLATMRDYGVIPQAWGSLAEGGHGIFTHPVLADIGRAHGKTAAQVALRWAVQRGIAIIPKSTHRERLAENLAIWDFALTDDEMARIRTLDTGHSDIVNHFDPAFVKMLHTYRVHD